jgi:hypothetical protein
MIKKFIIYNYQFFFQKRKEEVDLAWFSTIGIISLGFALNVATILFLVLGYGFPSLKLKNPADIIIGIPWGIIFLLLYFNGSLKRDMQKIRFKPISKEWRLYYWVYYILTGIIYIYAMTYYSQQVY